MVGMDEVAGFLKTVAPFDSLDDADLAAVAAAAETESYPARACILVQGANPSQCAWVVRQGAVELADEGRVIDLMGAGEMFGHRSMITADPISLTVTAREDTVCYRLPEHGPRPVLARPSALQHLVMSVGGRYQLRAPQGMAAAEPT